MPTLRNGQTHSNNEFELSLFDYFVGLALKVLNKSGDLIFSYRNTSWESGNEKVKGPD